jgi:hypothetical protein
MELIDIMSLERWKSLSDQIHENYCCLSREKPFRSRSQKKESELVNDL